MPTLSRCVLFPTFALLAAACTDESTESLEASPHALEASPADDDRALVYRRVRVLSEERLALSDAVDGVLSEEIADRVARPWLFRHEPVAYEDSVTIRDLDDGTTERTYEVFRVTNFDPWVKPVIEGPPTIRSRLAARLDAAADDDLVSVIANLRNYPDWDIPLASSTAPMTEEQHVARLQRRRDAIDARKHYYNNTVRVLIDELTALGAESTPAGWGGGWFHVRATKKVILEHLARRNDLLHLALNEGVIRPGWHLGEGRTAERTGADVFIDAGYDGDEGQPSGGRHSYTTVTIGIIEPADLEDEACFFDDGGGCDSSYGLAGRFECSDADSDGNLCEPITTFSDGDLSDSARHGTIVASTAIANYRQGQADGFDVGGVNANWEDEATGYAPEARVVFFGNHNSFESYADAYDDAIDLGLDITNSSWSLDSSDSVCDQEATFGFEQELENAFDDGVFNVTITQNGGGADTSIPCEVLSPGDVHKGFTVAAHSTTSAGCAADYRTCTIGPNRTGGADVKLPSGTTVSRAASLVDLAAPGGGVASLTGHLGTQGTLTSGSGSSFAAPAVAGMAALLKDMWLYQGETWINNPGRLHTAMLAMGDRHRANDDSTATVQGTSGTNRLFGMGRAKMRMFATGGGLGTVYAATASKALTSSSPTDRRMLWTTPMPTGTDLFKCVLYQAEDMSGGKDTVSDVDLRIRTRAPVNGACVEGEGATSIETWDLGADVKSMAALTSNLDGKCAEIDIIPQNVSATYGVTAWYFCYAGGILDDQPN